jgi:hypothetical protein
MQVQHIPFLYSIIALIYLLFPRQAVKHEVVDLIYPCIQNSEERSLDAEIRAQEDLVGVEPGEAVLLIIDPKQML